VSACAAAGFVVGLIGAGSTNNDWDSLGWLVVSTLLGGVAGVGVCAALTVWLVQRPGPHNGQTVGKQCLSIRVVRAGAGGGAAEIGVAWAVLREILAKGLLVGIASSVVSATLGFVDAEIVGLLIAAAIWYGPAFFDEQHRALHDRLCGTRVVDAPKVPAPPAAATANTPPPAADEGLWPAPS
jgi:uncharacterized RDD family membrane protein YckC